MSPRTALPVLPADTGEDTARALCAWMAAEPDAVGHEWCVVLAEDGYGSLPPAAEALPAQVAAFAAGMLAAGGDDDASARLLAGGAERGRALALAEVGHAEVMRLHFLLREALWRAAQRLAPSARAAEHAMAWLDPPLAMAASAALSAARADPDGDGIALAA
ncbi:MAG TPA: hypothetical protein VFJ16_09675 [Longimicrobium sp.]|nr:hypothetical protein [Longimicrobium sp.]